MLRRENAPAQLDVSTRPVIRRPCIARKAGFVRLPCSAGNLSLSPLPARDALLLCGWGQQPKDRALARYQSRRQDGRDCCFARLSDSARRCLEAVEDPVQAVFELVAVGVTGLQDEFGGQLPEVGVAIG